MREIHHALVLNMHQPPSNLDHLLETSEWEAKEILFAYDRMPRVLWDYQDIARLEDGVLLGADLEHGGVGLDHHPANGGGSSEDLDQVLDGLHHPGRLDLAAGLRRGGRHPQHSGGDRGGGADLFRDRQPPQGIHLFFPVGSFRTGRGFGRVFPADALFR